MYEVRKQSENVKLGQVVVWLAPSEQKLQEVGVQLSEYTVALWLVVFAGSAEMFIIMF